MTPSNLLEEKAFLSSLKNKDYLRKKINISLELALTSIGLVVTLAASAFLFRDIWNIFQLGLAEGNWKRILEQLVFATVVFFLIYGNVLYQLTRIGYFLRLRKFKPTPTQDLSSLYRKDAPELTLLLPSYKEEIKVIEQSILSSALQEYPHKKVVLLIDNPPFPTDPSDLELLQNARALPIQLQEMLNIPHSFCYAKYQEFINRVEKSSFNYSLEKSHLIDTFSFVTKWFNDQAKNYEIKDHTDQLFVDKIYFSFVHKYTQLAKEIDLEDIDNPEYNREEKFILEYEKLICLFDAELTSFERKRYANLSHEPNKAMNLNSYIGLMGKYYIEVKRKNKVYLEAVDEALGEIEIPQTKYLITLDADSILTPDYALRLVDLMEKPEFAKVAVIQTPYSAVPDPKKLIERISGATTDMQYIIHQGFTQFNATFWVGANALLRTKALDDIKIKFNHHGFKLYKFIQDRTVIEDTESSIDLVVKDWKLFNYPERLSYSATPADFGSLLIQRRRWANGGLIIFPKAVSSLLKWPWSFKKLTESFFRFHYLVSIAAVNIGLPILLVYPFNDNLLNIWLPLTSLPYYFFYGRDLILTGYKFVDLLRVYSLNLILIPINLGGVFKSIQQMFTGQTIPFKRTPKVTGRTGAPAGYILAEYFILIFCFANAAFDLLHTRWLHAFFAVLNGSFIFYGMTKFIGFRDGLNDLFPVTEESKDSPQLRPVTIKANRRNRLRTVSNRLTPRTTPIIKSEEFS